MTTYFGKSCSFGLLQVPFVNCRQFMYFVISLLVLKEDVGSDCVSSWSLLIILLHPCIDKTDHSTVRWPLGCKEYSPMPRQNWSQYSQMSVYHEKNPLSDLEETSQSQPVFCACWKDCLQTICFATAQRPCGNVVVSKTFHRPVKLLWAGTTYSQSWNLSWAWAYDIQFFCLTQYYSMFLHLFI